MQTEQKTKLEERHEKDNGWDFKEGLSRSVKTFMN